MFRGRFQSAARAVHDAHGIFHAHHLRAAGSQILFAASQAGQNERLFARHQMRAIQLGGYVGSEPAILQRGSGVGGIRRGGKEIPAQGEENFSLARVHGANGAVRVVSVVRGRREIELAAEAGKKIRAGFFPDTHSAVALHVAVSAHRAKTCAGASDIAAQQHEVDDLLDRRHGVPMTKDRFDHPLSSERDRERAAISLFSSDPGGEAGVT